MKKYISLILVLALWVGLTAFAWFAPAKESSDSERRPLAQMPELTVENLLSGRFMTDFADYAVDQFPLRDAFRSVNAWFTLNVLNQSDNNDIYIHDGYAAKMEYPLNESSLNYAISRFEELYGQYLTGADNILFCVVPDKGYYLADKAGALKLDYGEMFEILETELPWAQFVDITDTLAIESYYRTDTHWRQEALLPTAQKLLNALGITDFAKDWTTETLREDFYGVYYGQAALPMASEMLNCLTWSGWEDVVVYSADTGLETPLYDMDKLHSRDPYEIFLSGNMAIQTVTNPAAESDRHLILFRDSFGSSIAPLLAREYAEVTLIDTRYISPAMVGEYVDFENADVLFLYSTLVLNASSALRK